MGADVQVPWRDTHGCCGRSFVHAWGARNWRGTAREAVVCASKGIVRRRNEPNGGRHAPNCEEESLSKLICLARSTTRCLRKVRAN